MGIYVHHLFILACTTLNLVLVFPTQHTFIHDVKMCKKIIHILKETRDKILAIVEVDFLWNRTVDSLKTSFHPLLWTSSGLKG